MLTAQEFIDKLIPNFWSFLIQLLALVVLIIATIFLAYKPVKKMLAKRQNCIEENILEAEKICLKIRNHARKLGYRELESNILMTYANLLMLAGHSDRAVNIAKSGLFIVNEIHGEESVETLKAMNIMLQVPQRV